MKKRIVSMRVDEDFFNEFEKMRRKKQQELNLMKLGQVNFSNMLFNSHSIKYPKLRNVKKRNQR